MFQYLPEAPTSGLKVGESLTGQEGRLETVGEPGSRQRRRERRGRGLRGWVGVHRHAELLPLLGSLRTRGRRGTFILVPNKRRRGEENKTQRLSVSELATIFFG